jgi:UDP-glucuronate 4-epimerase
VKALVTGAAGFVGSHLAERLCAEGWSVRGVDCFTPHYEPAYKWTNLARLDIDEAFELIDGDLNELDLEQLLDDVDVVFHQAGQPGVRASWGSGFDSYLDHNVRATQRLLEAARVVPVKRFVYASSSSVYGNAPRYPTLETDLPRPQSPYGVTKLAAEHLCQLYSSTWDIPTVSLRYFTVYGPRQRPDMALHRFVLAALHGVRIPLYGDGEQIRDFTYVGDIVEANLRAAVADVAPGTVVNISGGASTTVNALLGLLSELVGPIDVNRMADQPGDVRRTGGSIDRARELLDWRPVTGLAEGLAAQVEWHRTMEDFDRELALAERGREQ